MTIERILIVDDEVLIRNFLAETLKRKNYEIETADCGEAAIPLIKSHAFDLVITDMKMPGMTGIDVLRQVKEISPETLVVVVTAFGSIENAVDAMRLGAFNYLIKPFSPDTIEAVIQKAEEHVSLIEENTYLRQQVQGQDGGRHDQVIGQHPSMQKILQDVQKVAKSNASIFITGESGTGKEVIAHAIHKHSLRANKPFIRVNCAAVPETLIESEFFGHEKGAFTGANFKRPGRFELANGGTLLLDEITEVPLALQAKLLRVVQEQEFERVGGSKLIEVNVRLVSTSNRNMKEAIKENVFREDLYYRLNVVPFHLPPLRERREDIIPLSEYFLQRHCRENGKGKKRFSDSAKQRLLDYPWPGNIRELANIIERTVVMDQGAVIEGDQLYLDSCTRVESKNAIDNTPTNVTIHEMEKQLILKTLQQHDNNRTKTAELLGISIRTLRNKINEYRSLGEEVS